MATVYLVCVAGGHSVQYSDRIRTCADLNLVRSAGFAPALFLVRGQADYLLPTSAKAWCPLEESNPCLEFRKFPSCPLNEEGIGGP